MRLKFFDKVLDDGEDQGGFPLFVALACQNALDPCDCASERVDQTNWWSTAPTTLRLRIRGVVEWKNYVGGVLDGDWYVGGAPVADGFNWYRLEISNPAQTYFLNPDVGGGGVVNAMDYVKVVNIAASAVVTLTGNSEDGLENANSLNLSVATPPAVLASQPFDGQFFQVDQISGVPDADTTLVTADSTLYTADDVH